MFETFAHPEMLIVGLALDTMHLLINNIAMDVKIGKTFENLREYDDILDGYRCAFRAVRAEHYKDLFGWAISHYQGTDFPALQCVWPDRNHKFPGLLKLAVSFERVRQRISRRRRLIVERELGGHRPNIKNLGSGAV